MSDIATIWDPANARADWKLAGAQLASGDDLVSAVLLSVFTDRRANADDVIPDGSADRRGWWGDLDEEVPIGSRLWLLERAKLTQANAARARDYIAESLQWLIDDGVAAAVDIVTQITFPNLLGVQVTVRRKTGSVQAVNFSWAWGAN